MKTSYLPLAVLRFHISLRYRAEDKFSTLPHSMAKFCQLDSWLKTSEVYMEVIIRHILLQEDRKNMLNNTPPIDLQMRSWGTYCRHISKIECAGRFLLPLDEGFNCLVLLLFFYGIY